MVYYWAEVLWIFHVPRSILLDKFNNIKHVKQHKLQAKAEIQYSNSTRGELEIIRSFPSCIYNITHINESPQGVKPIISCTMAEEER